MSSASFGARPVRPAPTFAGLDLGTNNCRMLVARPHWGAEGFRVVEAFSRIVRLGEGVGETRRLSDAAMARTLEALQICAERIARHQPSRLRAVATAACRFAENGAEFLDRAETETGLRFELITPEQEAELAFYGCAPLFDFAHDYAILFDIGGGSTEFQWLRLAEGQDGGQRHIHRIMSQSLPFGVVTLSEAWHVTQPSYSEMVADLRERFRPLKQSEPEMFKSLDPARLQMLGCSGSVTTLAGVAMRLDRYQRSLVDSQWLSAADLRAGSAAIAAMSLKERRAQPCIGEGRADLVVAGCAMIDAILDLWPVSRVRVADRGVREGIITQLMAEA